MSASAIVIADSGRALRDLTEELRGVPGLTILRHCSGRGPFRALPDAAQPHLVVLDELRWPRLALLRIREIVDQTDARIIVRASRPGAGWHADALRAGATAVVPRQGGVLRLVVQEVMDDLPPRTTATTDLPLAA